MKRKNNKSQFHKFKLSAHDEKLLERYCALNKISKNRAIKQILKEFLNENVDLLEDEAENQLGLFDSFQTNIFD